MQRLPIGFISGLDIAGAVAAETGTWRNLDFRIGVNSYDAAQDALEQVSDAARALGLVLNEHKTYISRFWTYMLRFLTPHQAHDPDHFDPDDVQIDSEYTLTDEETADQAVAKLSRIDRVPGVDGRIDLKRLKAEDLRELRGAINTLRRLGNGAGLPRVVHLFLFAPALTPRLTEYLLDMHASAQSDDVERIWDALTGEHSKSLSEWQATWLIYAARRMNLLTGSEARRAYVLGQRQRRSSTLLHAEASLALAEVDAATFDELDTALRTEPEPLAPWYALAIKALAANGKVDPQRLQAVRESSPLYGILIDS